MPLFQFAAHPKVVLHITDGGQRNVEDSIHHAVPVMGISYSSIADHYLHQMETFECGIVSYVDYDESHELTEKLRELIAGNK